MCDTVGSTGTVAACVSSIEDTSSPYASTAANCSFVQYWSNPTVFPIDCRCGDAAFESPCKRLCELSSVVTFGKGPRPRDLATEIRLWNGPVYGREWFVPAFWKTSSKPNQTMIYAIHLDTNPPSVEGWADQPEGLIADVEALCGPATRRDALVQALEDCVRRQRIAMVLAAMGALDLDVDVRELRERDRLRTGG